MDLISARSNTAIASWRTVLWQPNKRLRQKVSIQRSVSSCIGMCKAFRRYWRTCTRVKTQAPVCSNLIDASIYYTSRTAILWSITKVSKDCCPITTLMRQMTTPCTRLSARETSRRGSDEERQKAGSGRHPDNQRGIDRRACIEILSPRSKTALSLATGTMRWPLDQWASKLSMLRLHSTSRSFVRR